MKNKKPKTHIKYQKIFPFLICVFNFWFFIFNFLYGDNTGYVSLRIIPSARECAMGGAGVISAIGPSAMYYNPALTAKVNSFALNINYAKWFFDTYEQSLFLSRPLPYFNLGLGIVNFNAGELEARPNQPTDDVYGIFHPSDFNFFLNFSRRDTKMMYGISGRFYYEKIYEYSATGFGADAGLTFNPIANLELGVALTNFATTMRFIREDFWLPTKFTVGVTHLIQIHRSRTRFKIQNCLDFGYLYYAKKTELNTGAELSFEEKYFARAGYKLSEQANDYNLGFGLIINRFRIEYAYSPYNLNIPSVHHFSLSIGY